MVSGRKHGRRETGDDHLQSDTETSNQSGNYKHGIVNGSDLENRTDGENDDGKHDGVLPRESICDPALVKGAESSAEGDHGSHEALVKTRPCVGPVDFREPAKEMIHGEDDGDDTLAVVVLATVFFLG